jgi:hypothetical protein
MFNGRPLSAHIPLPSAPKHNGENHQIPTCLPSILKDTSAFPDQPADMAKSVDAPDLKSVGG